MRRRLAFLFRYLWISSGGVGFDFEGTAVSAAPRRAGTVWIVIAGRSLLLDAYTRDGMVSIAVFLEAPRESSPL